MAVPSVGDLEYFERSALTQDTIGVYNTAAAPGAGGVIATSAALTRGIYEVRFMLRITTGASASVTPDNYELRVGAVSKRRIVHNVQAISTTQILGEYFAQVKVAEAGLISINAVAAEVAASTVAASMHIVKVGDFLA